MDYISFFRLCQQFRRNFLAETIFFRYNVVNDNYSEWKFMVRLKDIAEKAGVSSMTVSRALNGKEKDISQATAEKIKKIAEEMGYVPNSSARALASHTTTKLIAALLMDYEGDPNPLIDSYNSSFLGEFSREIQKNGYDLMLHFIKDYSEINYCLKSWRVAGAVFMGFFDDNIRQIQEDNPIPLVFTDSYSTVRRITNVGIDDFHGGELAARYFLEHGHRNVAFLGPAAIGNGVVMHRLQGFCTVLREAGIQLPGERIISLTYGQSLEELLKELKKGPDPVTGIFTTADNCALDLYAAAYRLGWRIPDDLSIIGFDDNSVSSRVVPPLTTIRQDICQKARLACQLLMRKIADPKSPAENLILDVEIACRESVKDLTGC